MYALRFINLKKAIVRRKLFHLCGLGFIVPMLYLRPSELWLMTLVLSIFCLIMFSWVPPGLIAFCLLVLIIPQIDATAGYVTMIIGDGFATLFGTIFGRHTFIWNPRKTVEGTLSFILSASIILCVYYTTLVNFRWSVSLVLWALLCSSGAAIIESLPLRIDDNFSTVLGAGILITLLRSAFF